MNKEGEAAVKVVTTAKAILKSDPAPLAPLTLARTGLAEAVKGKEVEAILNSHRDLVTAIEQVLALADNHAELKANDAFLRLLDELKAVQDHRVDGRFRGCRRSLHEYSETATWRSLPTNGSLERDGDSAE